MTTSAFAEYINIPYYLKWSEDDACGRIKFHDLFKIPNYINYVNNSTYFPEPTTFWITINYPNNKFHDTYLQNKFNITKDEFQIYVNNQKQFIAPVDKIQAQIDFYTKKLDIENTIGLHIRRTDFKEQKQTSDDWFDYMIQKEISFNKNVKFFLN